MAAQVRMSQECACRRQYDDIHPMSINHCSEGSLVALHSSKRHGRRVEACRASLRLYFWFEFIECVRHFVAMNWARSKNSHCPSAGRSPASRKRRSMVKCESCRKKRIKVGFRAAHDSTSLTSLLASVHQQAEDGLDRDVFLAKCPTYRAARTSTPGNLLPPSWDIPLLRRAI